MQLNIYENQNQKYFIGGYTQNLNQNMIVQIVLRKNDRGQYFTYKINTKNKRQSPQDSSPSKITLLRKKQIQFQNISTKKNDPNKDMKKSILLEAFEIMKNSFASNPTVHLNSTICTLQILLLKVIPLTRQNPLKFIHLAPIQSINFYPTMIKNPSRYIKINYFFFQNLQLILQKKIYRTILNSNLSKIILNIKPKMMNPDGTFAEDISCIVPQKNGCGAIFISNIQAACNPNTLKKHGIGAVITAIKGKNLADKIPKHIEYLYIPVVDHQKCNISTFFNDSYDFIEEERKRTNVLVHCMAGVSRSVTLVIAYIMRKSETSFTSAFNYVKSKRPIIHPNEAFVEQLQELEKRLRTKDTVSRDEQKVENRTISAFGRVRQEENDMKRSTMHIKHQYTKQLSSTKGSNFSEIHSARTSTSWMQKSLSPSCFYNKENNSKLQNSYDEKLRQNIKKLFTQTHSRVRSIDRKEMVR